MYGNIKIKYVVGIFCNIWSMIICCNNSANTFKNRFYVLIGIHCVITINELIMWKYSFPVWIMSLIINAFCLVGLYYTCYYSDRKLRNSSLKRFANEMSDGFLLYNEHGDLIEVNDLLKYAFPPLIIKSFEFKENLDEWISDTITVNNIEVIKYELDGKDTYYKAKKTDIMDYDKYFVKSDLIPAVVQEKDTGEVLMLAYMNRESLQKTFETGYTWFWSRSRQELWNKGATSGHLQKVVEMYSDCDNDTLLVIVEQTGAACHTGNHSCFYTKIYGED